MTDSIERIREQARQVAESGVLGRSRSHRRLLEFLVRCTAEGRSPKEFEVGTEVFGKNADFDPSQDSMVRVYVHHLRQKIRQFYSSAPGREQSARIEIPKGEYRIRLISIEGEATAAPGSDTAAEASAPQPANLPEADDGREIGPMRTSHTGANAHDGSGHRGVSRWPEHFGVALLAVVGFGAGVLLDVDRSAPQPLRSYELAAETAVWRELFDDDLPIVLVVGDYYILGEMDATGTVDRLVREFAVNSAQELDQYLMFNPEQQYVDLDLTYLSRSTAFAMRDVLRVLYTSDKPVRLVSMSEFNVADVKSSHVVYIGYISALDKLFEFVFASSSLSVGNNFDELRNADTGDLYLSEAGMPAHSSNYRDYGLLSTFPGPSRNQVVVVAGTRDAGLMHSAQVSTDPERLRETEQRVFTARESKQAPAFELFYEVLGFDRTNLDAMLVHHGKLDYQSIWGGELTNN